MKQIIPFTLSEVFSPGQITLGVLLPSYTRKSSTETVSLTAFVGGISMNSEMTITVGSTITVEHPSSELVQWCKKNLVISNPEYAKKLRMHFWLGNTPKELYLYETHGEALILPYGVLRDILPMISSAKAYRTFTERKTVKFDCSVPLDDYQRKAVNEVENQKYGILQSPAGSGKTQMGIALMADLGLKTLWLTPTKDLLRQSKERGAL